MKLLSLIKICASLLGLVVFGVLPARAQSEVDPDHFDSSTTKPFDKRQGDADPKVTPVQYNATFTLPYFVQCNGKSLPPGKYSLSLRHDGKQGKGTLHQKEQAIEIVGIVNRQTENHRNAAVIVEVSEKSRRLSAIQLTQVDLVLDSELQAKDSLESKPKQVDRLPLKEAAQKSNKKQTTPVSPSHQC
jgi:hypothetical protein